MQKALGKNKFFIINMLLQYNSFQNETGVQTKEYLVPPITFKLLQKEKVCNPVTENVWEAS